MSHVESASQGGSDQASLRSNSSSLHPSNEIFAEDEAARFATFENYPLPHYVNLIQLGKHGFVYISSEPNSRDVICVGCKKVISNWNVGDLPGDPEFHEPGCRFIQEYPGSGHSSTVSNVTENLVRATVNNNEEATKPLETASTSVNNNMDVSPPHVQSMITSKFPVQPSQYEHRQAISLPHTLQQTQKETARSRKEFPPMRQRERHQPLPQGHSSMHSIQSPTPSLQSFQTSHVSVVSHGEHFGRRASRESGGNFFSLQQSSITEYQHPPLSRMESPTAQSPGQIFQNLNMRNAEDRLYTFELYWSETNVFRNIRLLVLCGFFCIGQGDAVECFCCHVIAANWSRNDNPRQRHLEMSPNCRFMKGEDCGDTPLPLQQTRRRTPASQMPSLGHPSIQSHHSSHSGHSGHSHHSIPPASYQSMGQNPVSQPTIEGASAAASEAYIRPSPSVIERSNLMNEFPCLNPASPEMREERARLASFENPEFQRNLRAPINIQELAQAGMYYLGDGDRCKCWFCDGGLKDFVAGDNPWVEHAKYFPECEYLLQQKGPAWVTSISVLNPNVERPILPRRQNQVLPQVVSSPTPLPLPPHPIEDPQQLMESRRQMLEEAMQSEPVQVARAMGFTDERIRDAQMIKIINSNCAYQTSESLIEVLLNPNGEPDTPEPPPQQGNVIDMSGQTIRIRGGNFIGPSVINGRLYHPPDPGADGVRNTFRSTRRNIIMINGRPLDDFIAESFNDPFFQNPMQYVEPSPPMPQRNFTFNNTRANIGTGVSGTPLNPARSGASSAPPSTSNETQSSSSEGATAGASTSNSNATAEERLEEIERERRCKVCFSNLADILFQPCGHICSCTSCSGRLRTCPVCRTQIVRYIKTYHV